MKMKLIFPSWVKLEHQTTFHLPPHGPVVFAAEVPDDVDLSFIHEDLQEIDFDESVDLVALSVLLTCQIPRAFEIADRYRAAGTPVMMVGMLIMSSWISPRFLLRISPGIYTLKTL